jgi:hypothetical protein
MIYQITFTITITITITTPEIFKIILKEIEKITIMNKIKRILYWNKFSNYINKQLSEIRSKFLNDDNGNLESLRSVYTDRY